jgi:hypothetical protein
MEEKHVCNYGCGKEATHQFKNGKWCCSKSKNSCSFNKRIPWNFGITGYHIHDEKTKNKIGLPKRGKCRSKETIEKIRSWWTEDRRNKSRELMKNGKGKYVSSFTIQKNKHYMLNGGAAYTQSFIRNPSKPQVNLYNKVKELYPSAILNYECLNYSVDIAIPNIKVVIEYDGSWWHQDKEKDLERQRKIEGLGWKFIRYKDKVPSIENLIEDIKNVK